MMMLTVQLDRLSMDGWINLLLPSSSMIEASAELLLLLLCNLIVGVRRYKQGLDSAD